ncbi:CPBP family intramembrane glutamic endopeptidase [Propionivibrio dicarboxylicus]|uniref:CAAX protease self-immunity n=1 Tax=Propionivibrio dicarboxylicus TaxID=83767 RepID=A0A1G8LQF1_9RHOO|nr:CPBP family intramembrane glutamic endopeptidase [Propionivibrio dicarboxylicus]SDI57929.1 CAAX protease self-immunity [Propionivibrio dicarboxylicus]
MEPATGFQQTACKMPTRLRATTTGTGINAFTPRMLDPQLSAFVALYLLCLSKRFWLGNLHGIHFWLADVIGFVIIPIALVRAFSLPLKLPFGIVSGKQRKSEKHTTGELVFYSILSTTVLYAALNLGAVFGKIAVAVFPNLLPPTYSYLASAPGKEFPTAVFVFYFAITPAVVEEYFFRGLARQQIQRVFGSNFSYVLISSLLFASIHWGGGLFPVVQTAVFGIAAALIYLHVKSLLPLMVGHFFVDVSIALSALP